MAFNPHIDNTAALLMGSAGGDISKAFIGAYKAGAEAKKEREDSDKELAHLQGEADFAHAKGYLTDEEMTQFGIGNLNTKRELAVKGQMLYADDFQQKRLQLQRDEVDDLKDYRGREMGLREQGANFRLEPGEIENIKKAGYYPAMTGPGEYRLFQVEPGPLQLTPEEQQQWAKSGLIPVRTAKNQFYPAPMPKAAQPFDPTKPPTIQAGGKTGVMTPDGKGGWRVQFPTGAATGTVRKPMTMAEASTYGELVKQKSVLEGELADHVQNIANGDNHYGFLNFNSRPNRVKEIQTQLEGINAQIGAMQGPQGAPEGGDGGGAPAAPVRTPAPAAAAAPKGKPTSSANNAVARDSAPAAMPTNDPMQSDGVLPPLASLPEVPQGKVRVKAPDGSIGLLPASQLERAKQQGFTEVK